MLVLYSGHNILFGILMIKSVIRALVPKSLRKNIRSKQNRIKAQNVFHGALRDTDVFLVGHPKSGNTWLAYMLGITLNPDNYDSITLANISDYVPNIHNHDESISRYEHLKSPRVFRNESPVFSNQYPKAIYILRDPRAVLLSYYHHYQHAKQPERTLDNFIEEMLMNGCIKNWEPELVGWDKQVSEWVERSKQQQVKIVRYEDLVEDRTTTLKKLINFAEISCDDNLFSTAIEKGDFKSMQKEELRHGAESYPGEKGDKGLFVRKGKVDSWKEEMPIEVIRKIENKFHVTMKKFGYLP